MCSSKIKARAFTLLEVLLAVCIFALVGVSIYRFVETTLTAVRITTASGREQALETAFFRYLRRQMLALPSARHGAITGEPHRFNSVSSDELRWIARPGSGLLTRHATGEWTVTLTTKDLGNGEYEMGLRRQDAEAKKTPGWLPLLRGVRGFEVRYYDSGRAEWMEKWTDVMSRPALIRVKLWRDPAPEAYEVVLPIPAKAQTAGMQPNTVDWNSVQPNGPANGAQPKRVNPKGVHQNGQTNTIYGNGTQQNVPVMYWNGSQVSPEQNNQPNNRYPDNWRGLRLGAPQR